MNDFLQYVECRRAEIHKEISNIETAERLYRESGASGGALSGFAEDIRARLRTVRSAKEDLRK